MTSPAPEGREVLICAPYGRDADSAAQLLRRQGYPATVHAGLASLAAALDEHVGVVLLTEEALRSGADELQAALKRQHDWSDIPFVILAATRTAQARSTELVRTRLRTMFSNAIVLERPLGRHSLLSAIDSAIRSRRRQFEMRDRLVERDRARQELAESNARLLALNETLEERVQERTARLMQAEAALRQSQKMEAVGQLTGGIAHDFNNMLTGVIGAMDIMRRRMDAGRFDGLERYMEAASTSAQRAATLTARLLAFSRRQSLDAKPLDVALLLRSLQELLRRTLRESIDLRIVTRDELPHAIADANQLESAILNLVINARDAMPDGGQLTVEVGSADIGEDYATVNPELSPGRYVVVSVTDTGVGMSPELVDKAFEPFFTTKAVGQGTGLGLSMVYGFARQSGGQVRIHSREGVGTAVSIYLRSSDTAPADVAPKLPTQAPHGAGEHVLVVEDDASVRLLIKDVLEELSYRPVEAAEAEAALAVLRSDRPVRLMVSDVGLPGMNGRQLAEAARQHRPDLPILFVTGYAENAAIRAGFLGTNMEMITKPFALDALAAKISQMLARADGGNPAVPSEAPR